MESLFAGLDAARSFAAAFVVAIYLAGCAWFLRPRDRSIRSSGKTTPEERGPAALASHPGTSAGTSAGSAWHGHAGAPTLLVHASQTGFAEDLAQRSARTLSGAGVPVRAMALGSLSLQTLQQAARALFVVSTTGEGDAPDSAARFVRDVLGRPAELTGMPFAVLALGDRDYRNYCAFGHQLHQWLLRQRAVALSEVIEVDNGDVAALKRWQQQLHDLSGARALPAWTPQRFEAWQLLERRLLNPDSAGAPCFHLALAPPAGDVARWSAGDIAVIDPHNSTWRETPALPQREYSIASLPQDGALHLLVRQARDPLGRPGLGSGWLTQHTQPGDAVALRVRVNSTFHAPADDRPLILIGNGTGIAGLRGLLKARIAAGHRRNWLLFGERNADRDSFYGEELRRWRHEGHIDPLDRVFSRDQPERRYVQHRLSECAVRLRAWLADGAAIYVCGSRDGMAQGVDAALARIMGEHALADLRADGRYRRDVY